MKTIEARRLARRGSYQVESKDKWLASQRRLAHHYAENVQDLRRVIEVTRQVRFWGAEYTITPRLVTRPLGNGRQLMTLVPLNTRPNFYVARVDDRWSSSNYDSDAFIDEGLDDLIDLIEEQFGTCDFECSECGEAWHSTSDCACQQERQFPALDASSGYCWNYRDWPG